MIRIFLAACAAFAAAACAHSVEPIDYVDPFIGTGFHGHTYPGAAAPFGMVQLSPDTRAGNWDACSGYHYDDRTIDGFSHTHLSGTGCVDLGDVLFYPTLCDTVVAGGTFRPHPYAFSHRDERASCGYYAVVLPDEGLEVELTAAPRTGVHRYTFRGKGTPRVVVDLMHTLTDERVDRTELTQTASDELCGNFPHNLSASLINDFRFSPVGYALLRDDNFLNVLFRGDFVHYRGHKALDYRTQSARTRL